MADRLKLSAQKRKILGRKVKKLRRDGVLPANLYGNKIKSEALELPIKEFQKIFEKVGEAGLVDLKTNGKAVPVLIHNVQFDPVSSLPIHADFHQVSLTEKTTADIPIELVGESPAVTQKIGILIQPLSGVEVEALPTDLPDRLTADISNLKEVDDAVTVADLMVESKKVKVLADKDEIVVMITPLVKEEVVVPPPPTEGEAVPTEGEAVPVEGAPPAGGPPEEGKLPEEGKAPEAAPGKPEGAGAPKPEGAQPKKGVQPGKPQGGKK